MLQWYTISAGKRILIHRLTLRCLISISGAKKNTIISISEGKKNTMIASQLQFSISTTGQTCLSVSSTSTWVHVCDTIGPIPGLVLCKAHRADTNIQQNHFLNLSSPVGTQMHSSCKHHLQHHSPFIYLASPLLCSLHHRGTLPIRRKKAHRRAPLMTSCSSSLVHGLA